MKYFIPNEKKQTKYISNINYYNCYNSSIFAKDKLSCFVTNYNLKNNDIIVNKSDSLDYFSQFNNADNSKLFELSLIELGGYGCKPCMKMDTVLSVLGEIYKEKLNIQIVRVTDDEGKIIAKYFGVNAIPTQIIIDNKGDELFRHTGFISKEKLYQQIEMFLE